MVEFGHIFMKHKKYFQILYFLFYIKISQNNLMTFKIFALL